MASSDDELFLSSQAVTPNGQYYHGAREGHFARGHSYTANDHQAPLGLPSAVVPRSFPNRMFPTVSGSPSNLGQSYTYQGRRFDVVDSSLSPPALPHRPQAEVSMSSLGSRFSGLRIESTPSPRHEQRHDASDDSKDASEDSEDCSENSEDEGYNYKDAVTNLLDVEDVDIRSEPVDAPEQGSSTSRGQRPSASRNDTSGRKSGPCVDKPGKETRRRKNDDKSSAEEPDDSRRRSSSRQQSFARDCIRLQIPCFARGCSGRNPTFSQLLRCAETHHNFKFCTKCCKPFPTKPEVACHTCHPSCISRRCGSSKTPKDADNNDLKHPRTDVCLSWRQLCKESAEEVWQYLFGLKNPGEKAPDPSIETGFRRLHGVGRAERQMLKRKRRAIAPQQALAITEMEAEGSYHSNLQIEDVQEELECTQQDLKLTREDLTRSQARIGRLLNIIRHCLDLYTEQGKRSVDKVLRGYLEEDAPKILAEFGGPTYKINVPVILQEHGDAPCDLRSDMNSFPRVMEGDRSETFEENQRGILQEQQSVTQTQEDWATSGLANFDFWNDNTGVHSQLNGFGFDELIFDYMVTKGQNLA